MSKNVDQARRENRQKIEEWLRNYKAPPGRKPIRFRKLRSLRGLGDLFHLIALPIARRFRLSCIDPKTGRLRPASPCARRQAHWNTLSSRLFRWSIGSLNRLLPFRAPPPRH